MRENGMFARKVQSVIWMDRKYQAMGKDARRHFESLYVFCDGFSSIGEAMATAETFGFSSSSFLYLCFCEMWYPITVNSYYSRLVITKEKVYFTIRPFTVPDVADTASFNPSSAVLTVPQQDNKKWQDGMCRDMQMIDRDLFLMRADGSRLPESRILWNNTVISFALNFFVREIKIATDKYVEQVFSNYYSDRSLSYEYEKIQALRNNGYLYYNPFLKIMSRTEAEKRKKEKALLKGLDLPPTIEREEESPGVKPMREREIHPCRIYRSSDRNFWRRW